MGILESEYDDLVRALSNHDKFQVADCGLRDNPSVADDDPYSPTRCITFGETKPLKGTKGFKESEREPLE